jgi:hypothetical protein
MKARSNAAAPKQALRNEQLVKKVRACEMREKVSGRAYETYAKSLSIQTGFISRVIAVRVRNLNYKPIKE